MQSGLNGILRHFNCRIVFRSLYDFGGGKYFLTCSSKTPQSGSFTFRVHFQVSCFYVFIYFLTHCLLVSGHHFILCRPVTVCPLWWYVNITLTVALETCFSGHRCAIETSKDYNGQSFRFILSKLLYAKSVFVYNRPLITEIIKKREHWPINKIYSKFTNKSMKTSSTPPPILHPILPSQHCLFQNL